MAVLMARDDGGTTTYAPDPLYTRMQSLRDLLDQHDHDDLLRIQADMQAEIEALREDYTTCTSCIDHLRILGL